MVEILIPLALTDGYRFRFKEKQCIEIKRVTKKYTHQLISFYIYVKRGREIMANKYLYIEKRVLEWKTNNEQEHIHLQWIIDLS